MRYVYYLQTNAHAANQEYQQKLLEFPNKTFVQFRRLPQTADFCFDAETTHKHTRVDFKQVSYQQSMGIQSNWLSS